MRLFIAIPFTPGVKAALATVMTQLRQQLPEASWVKTSNLHLTLKFLGEVRPEQVSEIIMVLNEVGREQKPFTCRLTQLGTLPLRGRARILYVATDQQEQLGALAKVIEEKLYVFGFPVEGHFLSHVTLARFRKETRQGVKEIITNQAWSHAPVRIDGISLIESQLCPQGAVYSELHRADFQA